MHSGECLTLPFDDDVESSDEPNGREITGYQAKTILSVLREMQEENRVHHREAATRTHVAEEGGRVIQRLEAESAELRAALRSAQRHLDLFSVRTILSVLSLVMVAFSTVVLLLTLLHGPLTLAPPLPHFVVIFSMGLYFMARKLPGRST